MARAAHKCKRHSEMSPIAQSRNVTKGADGIFQYINGFYNPRRRHSSLGGKSPLAFERKAA